ncbi:MAG: hypothetical protein DRN42_04540 [Thermoplasmata archaeon]|nr:MAG: hypothetical protein DRN55_03190 [Thermoplasmata archaeon]RLF74518.1 MAG: hypothetical protein DRN42_04540 [Thermoplasmata archaeon]HDD60285.1 hypothetical protein [Euryarchaeota archaeon]
MAKRRMVRREEEEAEIKLPEFDEEGFLLDETRAARITYLSLGVALLSGLLTGFIGQATWPKEVYGAIFGLAVAALMPRIFTLFRIDIKEVAPKRWAEAYGVYFVTWFVLWVMLLNPPFFDAVSPKVTYGIFETDAPPYPELAPAYPDGTYRLEEGANYTLLIRCADNWRVEEIDVYLDGNLSLDLERLKSSEDYNLTIFEEKWSSHGGDFYRVEIGPFGEGERVIEIVVKDPKGNLERVEVRLRIET